MMKAIVKQKMSEILRRETEHSNPGPTCACHVCFIFASEFEYSTTVQRSRTWSQNCDIAVLVI